MPRSPEKDAFLSNMLDEMEIERGLLNPSCIEILGDSNQSSHFIRTFALRVFAAADSQDRDGHTDM